ncbi:MAG TPA: DUF4836 family protein [Bacteroidaceae bacterium]|nr:DUF4836 family protein [Bacteroidaceae bacterium]
MKKLSILAILLSGLIVFSCQKKTPDFVKSIPDDAFAVVSIHPMQIHKKGQLNTLENLKSKIKKEVLKQLIEDPLSSGLNLNEHAFVFVTLREESPEIGVVAGMSNVKKFESMLNSIDEGIEDNIVRKDKFKMVSPDHESVISWNDDQVIMLISPDKEKDDGIWSETLEVLYKLPKEQSITSMVDFNNFTKGMKDLNAWVSSDQLRDVLKNLDTDKHINLPVAFYNNYAHLFCEFNNGAVNVSGKTNFSEEVKKNVDEYLIMKKSLNKDMLKLTPGDNLLMAVSASMDLEKLQKVIKDVAPLDSIGIGDKVEQMTGIPANELLQALTGDFTLAINGVEGESMIPVELFIGMGVDNEAIQDMLMGKLEDMTQVQKEGDFFIINAQGIEIYSGILNGAWVITNKKGYKDAVTGGGLKTALPGTRFNDFANRSIGMYFNLDLNSYPAMITQQLTRNPKQKAIFDYIAESFSYMGMSGGNYDSDMILKTNKPGENSLYTILKATEMIE